MRKADMIELLQEEFGITADPKWSAVEIRDRLSEVSKAQEESPVLRGLTAAKKSELMQRCDALNISVPEHATRGWMMRAIRAEAYWLKPLAHTDDLRFGKCAARTYRDMYDNEKKYVRWTLDTYEDWQKTGEDAPCRYLQRFVKYVQTREAGGVIGDEVAKARPKSPEPERPPKTSLSATSSKARPARATSAKRTLRADEEDEELEPAKEDVQYKMLVGAMATIMSRLDRLQSDIDQSKKKEETDSDASSWAKPDLKKEPTKKP